MRISVDIWLHVKSALKLIKKTTNARFVGVKVKNLWRSLFDEMMIT